LPDGARVLCDAAAGAAVALGDAVWASARMPLMRSHSAFEPLCWLTTCRR
jgi:hypothetical protein